MIITKTVKTKMSNRTRKHYESLGYIFKQNQEIEVPINHLPILSGVKVDVECFGCKKILTIQYCSYTESIKKNKLTEDYCCKKCFYSIRTNALIKEYGVNSLMKIPKFQNKKKQTMLERYGVENILEDKIIASKTIEKTTKTLIDKYGVNNALLAPGAIEKKDKTMLERYGTINAQEIPSTKTKTKDTLFKKYGVINVRSIPGVGEKIRQTKESLGLQRPLHLISELELYRNKCVVLKNKQRKELFNSWDGFDFYDKEYIKNYLNLHHNNTNYPTIDHKISILYGFLNNISVEDISLPNNLCITKKGLNSKKNKYNELEFIEKLKNKL